MKITLQSLVVALLIASLPIAGRAQKSATVRAIESHERKALFPSMDTINLGRDVAESACAGCHGMDGISDALGKPNLAGQRTVYIYRVLQAYQAGVRADEANHHKKFLNDEALLSVAVYYASLTPAQAPVVAVDPQATDVVTDEDPFENIRASMKKCIKCHDETGNSDGSGMPSLTGQDPIYFVNSMQAYIDGSRSHKLMKKLVGRLDATTIKDMGVYYAVQEPLQSSTQGQGDVNVGRRLSEDCKSCHGEDGNAKKSKMPTLAGQDAKYFIKAMKHYKDGKRQHEKMFEAVEGFSEQDMIDLATYYAAQQPRRRDVRTPLKSTEWIARCGFCHGVDGNSSDPRFPMLAGQDETYLRKALNAYATGKRDNSTMYAMADPLSPRDIERIGAFFAAQQPKAVVYMQLPCEDDAK